MSKLNSTEEGTIYRFIVGGQDSLVMEKLSKFKEEFENGTAEKITVFFPGIGNSHTAKIPRQFQTGELPTAFIAPILSEYEEKLVINSINAVADAIKKAEDSINAVAYAVKKHEDSIAEVK